MPPEAQGYIDLIESGSAPACRQQLQLVELVKNAFANEDLVVRADQLEAYLSYQKYFPFRLFEWEMFLFALHCCVFDQRGFPRWPELFIFVGRGAGKNGYLAFENFCLMTAAHGVPKYHIDSSANSERQATATFEYLYDLLESPIDPKTAKTLKKHWRWNLTEIKNLDTGSVYRYYTSSPKAKDGLKSGKVDFDEVHMYETRANIQVFETGLGKKPEPRLTYTSTDGEVNGGVLDEMLEQAKSVLSGEEPDNGFLPFICMLDNPEEVHDEAMWAKANPSYLYLPSLQGEMRREYVQYKASPAQHSQFMTKRMNVRQMPEEQVAAKWEDIVAASREPAPIARKTAIMAFDFAQSTDFVSVFFLYRDGSQLCGAHHSWFCEQSKSKKKIKKLDTFRQYPDILTFVNDVEISPDLVCEWAHAFVRSNKVNVAMAAMDYYRFEFFSKSLKNYFGFEASDKERVKLVRPSDIMKVQPIVSSALATHSIAWGDDPLMRWFANNTKLSPAPNNCFKYEKIEWQSRKTDGFMAFVAAMTCEGALPKTLQPQFWQPIIA